MVSRAQRSTKGNPHPDLTVDYAPRATLQALWMQYQEYGEWRRRTQRRHPESRRWRQTAAPLLVVGLGASLVMATTPARPFAAVVPATYAAALAATAVTELVRRRDVAALATPAAIATMHVAWGLGFLSSSGTLPEPEIPRLRAHDR